MFNTLLIGFIKANYGFYNVLKILLDEIVNLKYATNY